jgi:4-hydroxy-tetrahydrodipicolinate synthase
MLANRFIAWNAFRRLIDWHAASGSAGLVIMGSTGEADTVSMTEHKRAIAEAVEHAAERLPIIAGTGTNATSEVIELSKAARDAGAIAALSVVPYNNKPTQAGLFAHFSAIADSSDIPLILYNVPGRTVTDMSDEVVLRLGENPNIAGLKDATGDLARGISLLRAVPPDFAVYSGDDATAASLILHGARGNISVTANVVPAMMSLLCAAALCGDVATVRKHSYRMAPLNETMFVESNPIPVKFALAHLGYIAEHYRLPLTPLGQSCRQGVIDTLQLAMEREDE